MIGRTLSHYQIVDRIAAGGMGVVYRARDTRLNRDVALKVLPPETLADEKARRRFRQEAMTLSRLSHPNIGTIFDFDSQEGVDFLVMEYVGGEWLEDRIQRGSCPERDILKISIPVVEALAAAHGQGVIHRDLKPANIGFTADGHVKVLDFGLARLLKPVSEDSSTETSTRDENVAGTMPYMAPEQLLGKDIDGRSDLYAFGVVLYQMSVGRLPFREKNPTALSNEILHAVPTPPIQINSRISAHLQEIILRCLEKDPGLRYQTASDLKADLNRCAKELDSGWVAGGSGLAGARRIRRPWAARALGATALVVALGAVVLLLRSRPGAPPVPVYKQLTFIGGVADLALSPDGKSFAYVDRLPGRDRIMIRDIGAGRALEVFSASKCMNLRWSPDGAAILCLGPKGDLLRTCIVPRLGGSPRVYPVFGIDHAWSPDGSKFATLYAESTRLVFTDVLTGRTTKASLGDAFPTPQSVDWSPKDSLLVVGTVSGRTYALWTVSLVGNRRRLLLEGGSLIKSPRWSRQGDAIYFLQAHGSAMDLCKLKVTSRGAKPVVLLTGIESTISFSPDESGSSISFSHDESKLLYAREVVRSNLWRFERRAGVRGLRPKISQLTLGTGFNTNPSLSPDGGTVAFVKGDRTPSNISTIPIGGGDEEQLTFMNSQNVFPAWSPSGDEIAFLSNEGGPWRIWKVSTRGGPPQVFERSRPMDAPNIPAWAPGERIAYNGPGRKVLAALDPRSGVERVLVQDDSAYLLDPQWSADGARLAFLHMHWSGDAGHASVRVRPVSGGSTASICDSMVMPIGWSRDGQWVYGWNHLDLSERILAIPSRGGAPKVIMDIPGAGQIGNPTITGDGSNAVAAVVVRQRDAWLVENFQRPPH